MTPSASAFFGDGARRRLLAVQGVGGDDFVVEGGDVFEETAGGGLLATPGALRLVVNGDRLRGTVLVLGQREQANVVADHLAVEGERLRERARVGLQPVV